MGDAAEVARMEAEVRTLSQKLGHTQHALRAPPSRTYSGGSAGSQGFSSPVAFEGEIPEDDYDDDLTDDGEMTDPDRRRAGAGAAAARGLAAPASPRSPADGAIGVRRLAAEAQVAELQQCMEETQAAHASEVAELREKLQVNKKDTAETLGHAENLASAVEELEEELTAAKNENRQLRQRAALNQQQPANGASVAWMAQLVVDSGKEGDDEGRLAHQLTVIAAGIREREDEENRDSSGATKTGMPTLLEAAASELEETAASLAREREAHKASHQSLEAAMHTISKLEKQYAVKELQCAEMQQQLEQQQPQQPEPEPKRRQPEPRLQPQPQPQRQPQRQRPKQLQEEAVVPGYASPIVRSSSGPHRAPRRVQSPPGKIGALRPGSIFRVQPQWRAPRPTRVPRSPRSNTTASVAAGWSGTLRGGDSSSRPSSSHRRRRSVSNSASRRGWSSARGGGSGPSSHTAAAAAGPSSSSSSSSSSAAAAAGAQRQRASVSGSLTGDDEHHPVTGGGGGGGGRGGEIAVGGITTPAVPHLFVTDDTERMSTANAPPKTTEAASGYLSKHRRRANRDQKEDQDQDQEVEQEQATRGEKIPEVRRLDMGMGEAAATAEKHEEASSPTTAPASQRRARSSSSRGSRQRRGSRSSVSPSPRGCSYSRAALAASPASPRDSVTTTDRDVITDHSSAPYRSVSGRRSRPAHVLEPPEVLQRYRCEGVDQLAAELKKRFAENGCPLPFHKKSDFVYQLGCRKVTLNVVAEKLVVRLGGGYTDFLEFLEKARF